MFSFGSTTAYMLTLTLHIKEVYVIIQCTQSLRDPTATCILRFSWRAQADKAHTNLQACKNLFLLPNISMTAK